VKNLTKNILLAVNIIAVVGLLCSCFTQYIPPDKWWLPALLGFSYPWLLLVNLLFVVFWLIVKPVNAAYSFLIILAGWGMAGRFIRFPGHTEEKTDIKVVSYNVKHFTGKGKTASRQFADNIRDFLIKAEPDIICLQEVLLRNNKVFNLEELRKAFPGFRHYQYARTGSTMGSLTLTRFPIVHMEEIRFENSGNIAICTDILYKKKTIRIFNVHLQSYKIDPDKYDILESVSVYEEKAMKEFRELLVKYKKAVQKRSIQSKLIRKKIEESPYPVVVCGDFNDTPSSYAYRKTRGKLRDAFMVSGKGIGQTYVGKLPSFRIDYILHGRDFESSSFTIFDLPYSDHLPISCNLKIPEDK